MSDAYHQWKLLHPAFETVTVEEAFEAGAARADLRYAEGKQDGLDEAADTGYDNGYSDGKDFVGSQIEAILDSAADQVIPKLRALYDAL